MNNFFKSLVRNANFGLVVAAVVLFAILSLFAPDSFLSGYNMYTIGRTIATFGLIGLAQAMVMVVGDMNMAVGAIGGLATITLGYFIQVHHLPGVVASIIAVLVSAVAGAVNGFISQKLNINAFIVTLSTMFIYTGIIFGFTQGFAFVIPESFTALGKGDIFGIPVLFLVSVLIFVVVYIYFHFTISGRRTLAVGQNANAAKFSGVNNINIKILSHTLSGFVAGLAAVLYISRLGTAQPTIGQDWLIVSFTVAIIGGTALSGGGITAFGLLLGSIIMILIKNGLILLKTNVYWEQAFLGVLILIAVGIDSFRTMFNRRRLLE